MSSTLSQHLACPLDGAPLRQQERHLSCSNGHCFDIARQGYVNLLPVQRKRSKNPGDSKEMVAARRDFLKQDHYQPIAKAVADLLAEHYDVLQQTWTCLDAGCGEGYYLRQLEALLPGSTCHQREWIGVDISKWAIQSAAKQPLDKASWVVGTNAKLPVLDASIDVLICMFGFPVFAEFHRVLKPGGILVMVDVGKDHLSQLRGLLYSENKHEQDKELNEPEGFSIKTDQRIRYDLSLATTESIVNLMAMTPHYYRADKEALAKVEALKNIDDQVDVFVRLLYKNK